MRIHYSICVLVALSSLLLADNKATAFIQGVRTQSVSSQFDVVTSTGDDKYSRDHRTATRLLATSPSSSDHLKTNNNDKRTTELRAATGISLPSSPSIASPPPVDDTNDGGLGVLFLNLGGPTTGDDVEGAFRFVDELEANKDIPSMHVVMEHGVIFVGFEKAPGTVA